MSIKTDVSIVENEVTVCAVVSLAKEDCACNRTDGGCYVLENGECVVKGQCAHTGELDTFTTLADALYDE